MKHYILFAIIFQSITAICQIEDPILLEEGKYQWILAQEDFNKDGVLDLVLLEIYECNTIYDFVYYHGIKNDETDKISYNEAFREEIGVSYFTSPPIDIDGDNDLDLVLSFLIGFDQQVVCINQGDTFELVTYPNGGFPRLGYSQDINGDLIADGFEMDTYKDSLFINLSNGNNEWDRIPFDYCDYCLDYSMTDIDGDGDLDFMNFKDDTLYVSLIDSMEIVEKKKMYFHDAEIYHKNNFVADIDQNGELDFLLIKDSDDYRIDSLFILFNPASNSQLEFVTLIYHVHNIGAILDLDMDGIPSFLLNVSDGDFIEVSYSPDKIFEADTIEIIGVDWMYLEQKKTDFGKSISEIDIRTSDNFFLSGGLISRLKEIGQNRYLLDRFDLNPRENFIEGDAILVDIDNNGMDDIVYCGGRSILARTSNEDQGYFSNLVEIFDYYDYIFDFKVADINNDGWQDIVFASQYRLLVAMGIGQGSFGEPQMLWNEFLNNVQLFDMDCDGDLDIVFVATQSSVNSHNLVKVFIQNNDQFDEYTLELERYISLIDFVECNEDNDAELIVINDSDNLYSIRFEEAGLSSEILNDDVPESFLGKQIFINENKQPYYIKIMESDLNENEYILRLRKYNRETKQIEYVMDPITYEFDNPQFEPGKIYEFDVDGDKDIDIILADRDSESNASNLVLENLEDTSFSEPYLFRSIFDTDDFPAPFSSEYYSSLNCYDNGLEISHFYKECENLYMINGFSTKDIASSIDDLNNESKFYPNPTSGIIHFDNDVDFNSFMVLSSTGRIVKMNKLSSKNELDLSELDSGMYFLRFEKAGQYISRKIIIQK